MASSHLYRPNLIKFNVTSNILWGPAIIFSYERVFRPNKSFSVEAGTVKFPPLNVDLPQKILTISDPKGTGFKVDGDVRFYLSKENKYGAPHGLYLGPYVAYYNFTNKRDFTADTSFATGAVTLKTSIQFYQVGGEMGYQFMLAKDRIPIDFVLAGPALAYYTGKLSLDGSFDPDQENEYLQDLLNLILEGFPALGNLFENKEVSTNGFADLFFAGFRYSVSIGYRF